MKNLRLTFLLLLLSVSLFGQSTFHHIFQGGIAFTENFDLIKTQDNGFLSINSTITDGINIDFFIFKLNQDGEEEWRTFYDLDNGILGDVPSAAVETETHYIILGYTYVEDNAYPVFLFLNKAEGTIDNYHLITEFSFMWFNQMILTRDNKLALMGMRSNPTIGIEKPAPLLVKCDLDGTIEWSQHFAEGQVQQSGNFIDYGLAQLQDGSFVIGSGGNNLDTDIEGEEGHKLTLIKTKETGELDWHQSIITTTKATSVAAVFDEIVVSTDFHEGEDSFLLTFDTTGNLISTKGFGTKLDNIEECTFTFNSGIALVGSKENHLVVINTDEEKNILWETTIPLEGGFGKYFPRSILQTNDGGFVIGGYGGSGINFPPVGIFVTRIDANGEFGELVKIGNLASNSFNIEVFPNPSSDIITIQSDLPQSKIRLLDAQGITHYQEEWQGQEKQINIQHFPSGTYILELRTAKNHIYHKMIVKQ